MENNNQNTYQSRYLRASERISELKRFYGRCFRGIIAIIIVAAINYYLNEWSYPWFLWVVFGVGLSILLKAFQLYGLNGFLGRNWEERKIKELMDKEDYR